MEKVYWVKFYEDGRFVTAIGQPHQTRGEAVFAASSFAVSISNAGFSIVQDGPDGFHYDRFGTTCAVKIEEE